MSLTSGCIAQINQGLNPANVVVQVLEIKKIKSSAITTATSERYRLLIADGVHTQQAMVATQLNHMITNDQLTQYCLIQLKDYICNEVQDRKIVIILSLEVVHKSLGEIRGSPVPFHSGANSTNNAPATSTATTTPSVNSAELDVLRNAQIFPIKGLNPYQQRWTIKARVTNKSDIRTWSNAKGQGKLFNVDLLDNQGGEIRAVMFNNAVDRFYPLFEVGSVYYISRGYIKVANRKFSNINNDYEISLDQKSLVALDTQGGSDIPRMHFSFIELRDLPELGAKHVVDAIGVITRVEDPVTINTKTGNTLTKRTFRIVDSSLASVDVTLWREEAEKFQGQVDNVVALKSVLVSDFNGVSLGATYGTVIELNPDIEQAHSVKAWYNSQYNEANINLLSQSTWESGGGAKRQDPVKFFAQIKDEYLGHSQVDYFVTKGTVTFIKHDNTPWYDACPTEGCNKKVSEVNGQFFCEKCDQGFPTCTQRYILLLNASDHTGSQYLSCFNDIGESILGISASELKQLQDSSNNAAYEEVFNKAMFKSYKFKIRAKEEFYQDEPRVKCSIVSAMKLDYAADSRDLLQQIQQLELGA